MGRVLGIDLGTSNTAVACLENGDPVIVKNAEGAATTQSVVFCEPPHFVVGEVAMNALISDPERVVQFAKRHIGKDYKFEIDGQEYSPGFFAAVTLRKVVNDARDALGEEIDGVVITVPAYFGEAQRQATYAAGRIAGLNVLRLINEPTAAALAYGISHRDEPGYILVYDLGGGTFDVTILKSTPEALDVVAVGGDPELGGKDFDDALETHLMREIEARVEGTVLWDVSSRAELHQRAETLKNSYRAVLR